MKLSDLFLNSSTTLTQLALLLAFGMFLAIVVWALTRTKEEIEERARIPLEEHE